MCFKSKVKTPKPTPPKAPEPVLAEEPKGVAYGGSEEEPEKGEDGLDSLKVKKAEGGSDSGDGSSFQTSADTGSTTTRKAKSAPIKRAMRKATQ